jgi:hypothetical protein
VGEKQLETIDDDDRLLGMDDVDARKAGVLKEKISVTNQYMNLGRLQDREDFVKTRFHPCIPVIEEITQDVDGLDIRLDM